MRLDHLLYVGPDLAELVHDVKRLSGLGAAAGGQHPGQGTHNALLGLGWDSYLELMAPDPLQDMGQLTPAPANAGATGQAAAGASAHEAAPPGTFLRSIAYATSPQVFTWCAKARSARTCAAAARALGLDVAVYGGSRITPSGANLRWDLVILDRHGLGGVVPFFIDWHDSPHPAKGLHADRAEGGLELTSLKLQGPDPAGLTNLLRALGVASGWAEADAPPVTVTQAARPAIVAGLKSRKGPFELSGGSGQLLFG